MTVTITETPKTVYDLGLTSGQLEPNFSELPAYEDFPKEITGRTVWTKEQLEADESLWQYRWTPELIAQLEEAYTTFQATGKPLTAINKETWKFPAGAYEFLHNLRDEIVNGRGVAVIKGLPVVEWGVEKSAAIYLGIGTVFGYTLSQNGKGHVLGHVKDIGNDPTQIDKVRIYSTAARQFFHTDASDIVGLLCLHRAKEGGESDIVSAHHLFTTLQKERPDVVKLLVTPNWYNDRKGEQNKGQDGWLKKAVFYWHDGKLVSHFDPYFVKSTGRFIAAGLIPDMTPEQKEAIQVLDDTAQRLALHTILEVGDIQLLADTHVFHARTAYTDYAPPAPRRHLLRLWLSTPVTEGGWKRPFPDSDYIKRGGIQVDLQPETYPLDGE